MCARPICGIRRNWAVPLSARTYFFRAIRYILVAVPGDSIDLALISLLACLTDDIDGVPGGNQLDSDIAAIVFFWVAFGLLDWCFGFGVLVFLNVDVQIEGRLISWKPLFIFLLLPINSSPRKLFTRWLFQAVVSSSIESVKHDNLIIGYSQICRTLITAPELVPARWLSITIRNTLRFFTGVGSQYVQVEVHLSRILETLINYFKRRLFLVDLALLESDVVLFQLGVIAGMQFWGAGLIIDFLEIGVVEVYFPIHPDVLIALFVWHLLDLYLLRQHFELQWCWGIYWLRWCAIVSLKQLSRLKLIFRLEYFGTVYLENGAILSLIL